ncbi:hypothetical protein Thi970DRAFT_02325 [Thiorhodovibrio frisius]|uniref:DUF4124 domain-containing protein n=2 Tax=Thiorhodovibrio frisius TaxID=631362 RepID=H8YZF0_9GAMM|nr:hypothetical protein Thi970DRAFT_02325 [Thiorhodovibrio frisius]WPL24370.1 hypothetical protein Thiofri_04589 [Thiorhodovibrio frisius]
MMKRHHFLSLCLLIACNASAAVFQCEQSDGITRFQSVPCEKAPASEAEPKGCPPPEWLPMTKDGDCGELKLMRYESTYKMPVVEKAGDRWQSEKLAFKTCASVVFFLCETLAADADQSLLAKRFEINLKNGSSLEGNDIRITSADSGTNVYKSEVCFGCPDCELREIVEVKCLKE